jgi:hypothetical protein
MRRKSVDNHLSWLCLCVGLDSQSCPTSIWGKVQFSLCSSDWAISICIFKSLIAFSAILNLLLIFSFQLLCKSRFLVVFKIISMYLLGILVWWEWKFSYLAFILFNISPFRYLNILKIASLKFYLKGPKLWAPFPLCLYKLSCGFTYPTISVGNDILGNAR